MGDFTKQVGVTDQSQYAILPLLPTAMNLPLP
jgi:hypothetical protein